MHLRALSIDKDLKDSLAGEKIPGSTLSVYDRAVYLKTDEGSIIAIGCPDIGNGPGFILLDHGGGLKSGHPAFYPDERFEMWEGILRVGGDRIVVEVGRASVWDPFFPPVELIRWDGLEVCMATVQKMVRSSRVGNIAPVVHEKVRALADALVRDCEMGVRIATRMLIGLGEGLTPSCDDLLVGLLGFMYGLRDDPATGAYASGAIASLGEELASAAGKTTPIAAHFLSAAARGRFTERVKGMLEAIFAADEKRMERASKWLLEYGSTSGADLMCGMVLGYEAIKGLRIKN